jgi:hypothetical protein
MVAPDLRLICSNELTLFELEHERRSGLNSTHTLLLIGHEVSTNVEVPVFTTM